MSFRFPDLLIGWLVATAIGAGVGPPRNPSLRICADPDNLPFSNQRREGFENRIADLLARELRLEPVFVWREQRERLVGKSIGTGDCDVVMGIPTDLVELEQTGPYYRSRYVLVTWGPLVAYWAKRSLEPSGSPSVPFGFDMAVGVRKGDTALAKRLDAALSARRSEVAKILGEFGIPAVARRP